MAPQFSVPAARASIMVNIAYMLGAGAITALEYNTISRIVEDSNKPEPLMTFTKESNKPQARDLNNRSNGLDGVPSNFNEEQGNYDSHFAVYPSSQTQAFQYGEAYQMPPTLSGTASIAETYRSQKVFTITSQPTQSNAPSQPSAQAHPSVPVANIGTRHDINPPPQSTPSSRNAQDIRNEFAEKVRLAASAQKDSSGRLSLSVKDLESPSKRRYSQQELLDIRPQRLDLGKSSSHHEHRSPLRDPIKMAAVPGVTTKSPPLASSAGSWRMTPATTKDLNWRETSAVASTGLADLGNDTDLKPSLVTKPLPLSAAQSRWHGLDELTTGDGPEDISETANVEVLYERPPQSTPKEQDDVSVGHWQDVNPKLGFQTVQETTLGSGWPQTSENLTLKQVATSPKKNKPPCTPLGGGRYKWTD